MFEVFMMKGLTGMMREIEIETLKGIFKHVI